MACQIRNSSGAIKGINDNFEAIVDTATAMGDKIEKVTFSNRDIVANLSQINVFSDQAATAAQNVAAISEETSAASDEFSSQALELRQVAAELHQLVHGVSTASGELPVSSPSVTQKPAMPLKSLKLTAKPIVKNEALEDVIFS